VYLHACFGNNLHRADKHCIMFIWPQECIIIDRLVVDFDKKIAVKVIVIIIVRVIIIIVIDLQCLANL